MIANPKHAEFPKTWVTKLDRLLQGAVMDRRGVVITSLDSAQAIDDNFTTQINELRFDVEGRAPRLAFKEFVQEYLNWWNVEYQYGREQALSPALDWDIALLVVSVLMSGLDELLRQVIVHCQVTDLDIPFNDFQSKHDIEEACTEMLEYLKRLGGNLRHLPITPAAILQEPDIIFRILSRICSTLKEHLLQLQETLSPRAGLRRTVLEQLGREYNEKLERELLPIDRSALIYGARDTEMNNSTSLKRKRKPTVNTNGVSTSTSSPENGSEDLPSPRGVNPKRSRTTLDPPPATPEPPLKLSFKVEMAKARLDLRVLQAVDLDGFPDPQLRAIAQAKILVEIAEPLVDKILKSDVPLDKDVVECRAVLELIAHAEEPVFDELSQAKALAIAIERLAHRSGVGNLEFRELVNSAKRLSTRLPY
ncbi:hypothetical protein M408DRAFT_126106 [Serendipita vermifera MAFF 305830]|uniref:Uncharacterized protein n=1 Tax=Serendipita vermifera MAFF 305830 TaxID=933852 RepID=A0A0C3BA22_SERVB|nr:hypothetical protein M408DRAFT_126106 [Serendipita vermifera MAFF 305830]